ncbi:hypothetical protein [Sandaracinobacteroides saxicola]|uniref:Uncharacterized protein n=1 Tax=Sandaracinobacteroides saxicola TaxID=2759707 RepID=A0A7G5IFF1_9SPHN|nr:hypothetical protein [Sandaracinobacteroides saxicola]QMW22093.1 hypothetical protein H3309_12040 [Sandaracinobacteroides saxicola]
MPRLMLQRLSVTAMMLLAGAPAMAQDATAPSADMRMWATAIAGAVLVALSMRRGQAARED